MSRLKSYLLSEEEIDLFIKDYPKMSIDDLVTKYSLSSTQIRNIAHRLNIKRIKKTLKNNYLLSDDDLEKFKTLYEVNTNKDVAIVFDISQSSVNRLGIKLRLSKSKKPKKNTLRDTKPCNRCKDIKRLSEFRKVSKNKDGRDYTCKECMSKRSALTDSYDILDKNSTSVLRANEVESTVVVPTWWKERNAELVNGKTQKIYG